MNTKRWFLAGLAGFAVIAGLDMVVHGHLLMGLYQETKLVWRGEESHKMMWLMMLGSFLFSLAFAWIYAKGYETRKPGLAQGLRYGFLIGLLTSIFYVTIWYVVLPIPLALSIGWSLGQFADCLAAGIVVGLIYRN